MQCKHTAKLIRKNGKWGLVDSPKPGYLLRSGQVVGHEYNWSPSRKSRKPNLRIEDNSPADLQNHVPSFHGHKLKERGSFFDWDTIRLNQSKNGVEAAPVIRFSRCDESESVNVNWFSPGGSPWLEAMASPNAVGDDVYFPAF